MSQGIRIGCFTAILIARTTFAFGADAEQAPAIPAFAFPAALQSVDFEFPDVSRTWSTSELEDVWQAALLDEDGADTDWDAFAVQRFLKNEFGGVIEVVELAESRGFTSDTIDRLHAFSLEAHENWDEAATRWQRVHARDAADPLPGIRMAICLMHDNKPDAAVRALRQLSLRFPDHVPLNHLLAAMHWASAQPAQAWRTLARTAARAGPVPDDSLLFLSWISLQRGDEEEAVGWLSRALRQQTPEQQLVTLSLPYFQALRDLESHDLMLAEFNIPRDYASVLPTPSAPRDSARVVFEAVTTPNLPDSLRVSIHLRDADDQARELWNPETGAVGLRLGVGDAESTEPRPLFDALP